MKASSESGLWAQTMSFTEELVIGVKEHTIAPRAGYDRSDHVA